VPYVPKEETEWKGSGAPFPKWVPVWSLPWTSVESVTIDTVPSLRRPLPQARLEPPVLRSANKLEGITADAWAGPSAKTRFYEQTVLRIAAHLGDFDVARCLIEGGADKEARTNGGWTPFLVAASKGHFSIAALLVER